MLMAHRHIIVVGASAGGLHVLEQLARSLPPGLPASLFVVCHFPAGGRSILPEILSRSGPLLATHAVDGETFYPGQIYVAPPNRHLVLTVEGRMALSLSARENNHRPAIDPLFRSAARAYGRRVIGVILSGALNDGTAGLMAIRAGGGLAVIQDPKDAVVAAMPQSAGRIAGADIVAPAATLGQVLVEEVRRPLTEEVKAAMQDPFDKMARRVSGIMADQTRNRRRGEVSVFSCPECGGTLWQDEDQSLVSFRCHVGHVYDAGSLMAEQGEMLEAALWTAVRIFKEQTILARQLANVERAKGDVVAAARMEERADLDSRYGDLIRRYILTGGTAAPDGDTVPSASPERRETRGEASPVGAGKSQPE
jgi:two-component system chemotaxis response regulator CheB